MGRRAPVRSAGVSVAIADLETGEIVYARNPEQAETIASVTKMISSAAALHYLGPTYKFRTTFWRRGEVHDGNLVGSLLVVGGGDPNISGRFYENDSFAVFDRWAEGLQAGRDRARLGRPDPERERLRRHLPPPGLAARPRHALVPGARSPRSRTTTTS